MIYREQGIRPIYLADLPGVCETYDYRWAMAECARLDVDSHLEALSESGIDAVLEDVAAVASTFRTTTSRLIESGRSAYGDRFERALADVAAGFLTGHANLATGGSYVAFSSSRAASRDPERLGALQRYNDRSSLPQPLEREWLRRHDPELETVADDREERMAGYAVYHDQTAEAVHPIVGAAYRPGVTYSLDRSREGRALPEPFERFREGSSQKPIAPRS